MLSSYLKNADERLESESSLSFGERSLNPKDTQMMLPNYSVKYAHFINPTGGMEIF